METNFEANNKCKVSNIYDINFKKCVKGFHLINSSFINETIWEHINATIFSSLGIDINYKSNGSHSSGMDINCSLGRISNKSAKYSNNKKSIDISSYRLTTVCSAKKCGTPTEIIEEIHKRTNFDYYSFIVRDETDKENISYDWLLIPSDLLILDPSSYTWEPMIGKREKNKDIQVGWNTNEINGCKMSITFSMSSQLWLHIEMTKEIKKFIVASAVVENKPKYNYIDLLEMTEEILDKKNELNKTNKNNIKMELSKLIKCEENEKIERIEDDKEEINNEIITQQDLEINKIYNEDCVVGMKKIKSESVDIIICDPPYNIGKDFGNNSDKQKMDDYLLWCDNWIVECLRILKPHGTLYIYGFSEILAFIRTRLTCDVRWLVWHYTNKVTPSLNFWQRTHESILCCYKEKPIFNRDDVREPYTEAFLKNAAGKVRKPTVGRFSNGDKETTYTAHEGGALPRDVIKVPALAGGAGKKERVDHPTQKPLNLCDTLIKASLNKLSHTLLVVPFVGSGSECVSAKKNNVNFIGFELNGDYINIANKRLNDIDN